MSQYSTFNTWWRWQLLLGLVDGRRLCQNRILWPLAKFQSINPANYYFWAKHLKSPGLKLGVHDQIQIMCSFVKIQCFWESFIHIYFGPRQSFLDKTCLCSLHRTFLAQDHLMIIEVLISNITVVGFPIRAESAVLVSLGHFCSRGSILRSGGTILNPVRLKKIDKEKRDSCLVNNFL